jgi:hypothetical protein
MAKYRKITKLAKPGSSTSDAAVVNIYQNGVFKLAYKYKDWSSDDIQKEIIFLQNRFPDYRGWKVEKG